MAVKTIHVYRVLSGDYRAYVKSNARQQAWGVTAEIAVKRLLEAIGENILSVIVEGDK